VDGSISPLSSAMTDFHTEAKLEPEPSGNEDPPASNSSYG
jgi:hypothetical protein